MNWDDLKCVLALHRGGTFSAAAQRLGNDQTTISRRLKALEGTLGVRLFVRGQGRLLANDAGTAVVARAERVEAEMIALQDTLGAAAAPSGSVRLTAVPILVNRLLVPRLASLVARHPALVLEMSADARNLSLGKRDADIALRLARPQAGTMLCRRVGSVSYSVYGAARREDGKAPLQWLDYDESLAHLPQARWVRRQSATVTRMRAGDAETLLAGVRAGLGRAVLPDFAARPLADVERQSPGPVLSREVWMLVHPDLRDLPRIAAVQAWLSELFAGLNNPASEEVA